MPLDPAKTALVLVDVQAAFLEREQAGERRNNPHALSNMARLVAAFRDAGRTVIHVRHASTERDSRLRPERPGFAPIPQTAERAGEPVLVKSVNSAFIGTDLEALLRGGGIATVVFAGITTNHCVETSARMAGNLGFDVRLAEDACYTFDRTGHGGRHEPAEDIHRMTLSNLDGEFATIETTQSVLAALAAGAAA
ncbi:cysteine hydrolase [Aquibium sp. A9E412]|uniref:cysteine hydrolase family protein n=1 Tax=Aquibium sp. A9E412 TaxID=2976767 RepID=UPI0025B1207C|nr:cysteine hydrolase family protein [Aquibium sp. A9E412]MDN2567790.1 cysteine hydrolase [Aquibium sp. A9E412]